MSTSCIFSKNSKHACAYEHAVSSAAISAKSCHHALDRELCAPDRAPQLLGRSPDERTGALVADGVQLGHKAVVGGGSLVGARTRLGDRTSVKRCVLGPGCTLGAGVKLDKCVLMEGVTVGDGAQLHGCIICANAHIEVRSRACCTDPCVVRRPAGFGC